MQVDRWITRLAGIGTCLAAVATFFTVYEMNLQRKQTYRPELALTRIAFDGSSGGSPDYHWPTNWKKENEPPPDGFREFHIPLRNIGLGAAKSVSASWSFPLDEVVKQLNEHARSTKTDAHFEGGGEIGILSVNSGTLGGQTAFWKTQQTQKIDFVLPLQFNPKQPC
jgi:hypothetical protein